MEVGGIGQELLRLLRGVEDVEEVRLEEVWVVRELCELHLQMLDLEVERDHDRNVRGRRNLPEPCHRCHPRLGADPLLHSLHRGDDVLRHQRVVRNGGDRRVVEDRVPDVARVLDHRRSPDLAGDPASGLELQDPAVGPETRRFQCEETHESVGVLAVGRAVAEQAVQQLAAASLGRDGR
jgi:hypothetical protein